MDFTFEKVDNLLVISVNIKKATFFELSAFNELLKYHLTKNTLNFIVDLSYCEYIDSVFLSGIINLLRIASIRGGNMKVVKPQNDFKEIFSDVKAFRAFDFCVSKESAIRELKGGLKITLYQENAGKTYNSYSNFRLIQK